MFCWTKFGTEAGEPSESIIRRKEEERVRNLGTFLWGIGNSIAPSLAELVRSCAEPEVLFTPMLSAAASRDVAPDAVVAWTEAVGMDGAAYRIPDHSVVTSRFTARPGRARHFALVCGSAAKLSLSYEGTQFSAGEVNNLRTGSVVGSSQVTSVVRRSAVDGGLRPAYRVAFRARLIYPYLVTLTSPVAACGASGDRLRSAT